MVNTPSLQATCAKYKPLNLAVYSSHFPQHLHSACGNMSSLKQSKMAKNDTILLTLEHEKGGIVMYYVSYAARHSMWEIFSAQ